MNLVKTEGVVLHALPFKDYDFILTLFTPEGIQKLYAKANRRYNPLAAPLTVAEYVYATGRGEIAFLRDGTLIDQNLKIREELDRLFAANELIDALIRSQWPGKSAPRLYILFRYFLDFLNRKSSPHLATAFYLKVMKHEGILQLHKTTRYRYGGECCEEEEIPQGALLFAAEEEECLHRMVESRSLESIAAISCEKNFSEKIKILFHQAFERSQIPK